MLVLFLLLLPALPARAAWMLSTADAPEPVAVTVNTWSVKDGLSYSTDDGKLHTAATRAVVRLASGRDAAPGPLPWVLRLRDGDVIYGEIIGLKAAALDFRTLELGTIAVPLRVVAGLSTREAANTPLAAAPDHDTLRLKNGDSLDGVLTALTADQATIQSDLGDTPVDLSRVSQLALGGAAPARGIPALALRVRLLSGTVLTTPQLTWTINSITLQDPAQTPHQCAADQIVAVDVLGGRIVRLAEIDPARSSQTSYLNTPWPMQTDRNVTGGPLRVDGKTYDHGLGVHTSSTLAYDLDGSFTGLRLAAALDDSAAPYGRADLSILVDGKTAWEARDVAPGKLLPVTVDLRNARHVELRATSSASLDVLGRVDWIDPVLVRP